MENATQHPALELLKQAQLVPNTPPNSIVLDSAAGGGCVTAAFIRALEKEGKNANTLADEGTKIVCGDLEPHMVSTATARFKAKGWSNVVDVQKVDVLVSILCTSSSYERFSDYDYIRKPPSLTITLHTSWSIWAHKLLQTLLRSAVKLYVSSVLLELPVSPPPSVSDGIPPSKLSFPLSKCLKLSENYGPNPTSSPRTWKRWDTRTW